MNSPPVPLASTSPVKKIHIAWIPLVAVVGGLLFGGYMFFWPEHQRQQLIQNGVAANAVILAADPTGSVYNNQPEIRLKLQVTPQGGQAYSAETVMVINAIYAPQFQPGKRVKVRYDQKDRSKVAVEETESGQR